MFLVHLLVESTPFVGGANVGKTFLSSTKKSPILLQTAVKTRGRYVTFMKLLVTLLYH